MFERLLRKLAGLIVDILWPQVEVWLEQAKECKTFTIVEVKKEVEKIPVIEPPVKITPQVIEEIVAPTPPTLCHSCGHYHYSYATSFKTHESICIECHNKKYNNI